MLLVTQETNRFGGPTFSFYKRLGSRAALTSPSLGKTHFLALAHDHAGAPTIWAILIIIVRDFVIEDKSVS